MKLEPYDDNNPAHCSPHGFAISEWQEFNNLDGFEVEDVENQIAAKLRAVCNDLPKSNVADLPT